MCYAGPAVQAGSPDDRQENARQGLGPPIAARGCMTKVTEPQFIESTAGQVAAELARRGIAPERHVTITIEPDDWVAEVRKFTRPCVIAQGGSDADIDRIIDEEQDAVQPRPE
jgi:hypothetical protein